MPGKNLTLGDLERLFEEIGDDLFRYLNALCRNPDDASDLLQSVFVKFIEQVKKGRILEETAHHYLRRMAKNEFHDFLRRKQEVLLGEEDVLVGGVKPADERMEHEETSRQIRVLLLESLADPTLPAEVAEVLRLRLEEGIDLNEICKRVNRSRSSVYRMMQSGLDFLAREFKKAGITIQDLESGA